MCVIARTLPAVEVGTRAAGWNDYQAARFIHGEHAPGIGGAGARLAFAGPRNRVPGPAKLAGSHIKSANHTALHIHSAVIADRRTGDDKTRHDRRWRGHLVVAAVAQVDAASEIDLPVRPEILARPARARVESNQSRIEGPKEDAGTADRPRRRIRIGPCRHASGGHFRIAGAAVDIGVILPLFGASRRIERVRMIGPRNLELGYVPGVDLF